MTQHPRNTAPISAKTWEFIRWFSDIHCLWRYCDRRACQRQRTCRGDVRHCVHFFPLVPAEAREFILGWDEALEAGLSWEEMMEERADEWAMLLQWHEMVRDTLPENIAAERQRSEAAHRARPDGQSGQ